MITRRRRLTRALLLRGLAMLSAGILCFSLAACGTAATYQSAAPAAPELPAAPAAPQIEPAPTEQIMATEAPAEPAAPAIEGATDKGQFATTLAPTATFGAAATATGGAGPEIPPSTEERMVEVEWPLQMRLGDSDTIRLALVPSAGGYTVRAEFPEHQTSTEPVEISRPGGYDLSAIAWLEGAGFDISPDGAQPQGLPVDTTVTWRWTLTPRSAGQHRLSLRLNLRWIPQPGSGKLLRDTQMYSKPLTIQVASLLGLTTLQAGLIGLAGIVFGGSLGMPLAWYIIRPRRPALRELQPNPGLVIEQPSALKLSGGELTLLRALFHAYARITLEAEYRSGYSGARAFLALPVRSNGRVDAYTIAKLGERAAILREYGNYMAFVKDTLPPITARIQETPVALPSSRRRAAGAGGEDLAALRYTFIGESGRTPVSLRSALTAQPDSSLLDRLFATFGPGWWMQRRPYAFRVAQEYDRILPAHYVVEPAAGRGGTILDGGLPPDAAAFAPGQFVRLRNFHIVERRPDGASLSLAGKTVAGSPPLRIRWLGLGSPEGATGRIRADRYGLLREYAGKARLFGLADPLAKTPRLLQERVIGTQSIIHGDLNLENILIGPGNFVWLIDFAQTREGHPLFDFAHLEAEILAHIVAPAVPAGPGFLALWRGETPDSPFHTLLTAIHGIASRCLFNPSEPREYQLALFMACTGALKFTNLTPEQRGVLYLTAAELARTL
jgi:hypothetical protein